MNVEEMEGKILKRSKRRKANEWIRGHLLEGEALDIWGYPIPIITVHFLLSQVI